MDPYFAGTLVPAGNSSCELSSGCSPLQPGSKDSDVSNVMVAMCGVVNASVSAINDSDNQENQSPERMIKPAVTANLMKTAQTKL